VGKEPMNKAKKTLVDLRNHLGRDEHGKNLLDAVSRELTEQRHRIASLEESNRLLQSQAQKLTRENCDAKVEIATLSEAVETERQRVKSGRVREEDLSKRLQRAEHENEVADEISDTTTTGVEQQFKARLKWLSKEVRRRYRKIPPALGTQQAFNLSAVVREYSYDEFAGLGMLMTLLAMHNLQAAVMSDFTVADLKKWDDRECELFLRWYHGWIRVDTTMEAICDRYMGPRTTHFGQVTERNVFTPKRPVVSTE
jgi:hypothetical protein